MCAINGVYLLKNSNKSHITTYERDLVMALNTMKTRGPDESCVVRVNERCVMGGNRLIIRGSKNDNSMPYVYGSITMFYNGEIYNYAIWDPGASPDGRVISPLFRVHGPSAFALLDGEFAISLWDDSTESLYLVRDQLGTKPLYFSLKNGMLTWGSSEASINTIAPHDLCRVTQGPLYERSLSVQEPYTSFDGIWLVPPGHYIKAHDGVVSLHAYHTWREATADKEDTKELFSTLTTSLKSRLTYDGTLAIPMSGGIDSGIIAFTAEQMRIPYELFCVTNIFGEDTYEKRYIERRVKRLKHCKDVHLLSFTEQDYEAALADLFKPNYYNSEYFDNGAALLHKVYKEIHRRGLRVAIDGAGGDELFFGYGFRDQFTPVVGWPEPFKKNPYLYAIFSLMLNFTAKADRAGSFFSIESRFPFQSVPITEAMLSITPTPSFIRKEKKRNRTETYLYLLKESVIDFTPELLLSAFSSIHHFTPSINLKWPLRKYLLEHTQYGIPSSLDIGAKKGFAIQNRDRYKILNDYKRAWRIARDIDTMPTKDPTPFPFIIGQVT